MRVRMQVHGASRGARDLARAAGIRRLRLVRTRFRARSDDIIINWGSGQRNYDCRYWNDPQRVRVASSKLSSLRCMREGGVNVPDFTTDRSEAEGWLREGHHVVARTLDRASSGRGITLCSPDSGLVPSRLYTKYVKKYDEYRVHVWNGEVIDVQQKRRRNGEDADSKIRTATNGWVFCRADVEPPQEVINQSLRAVRSLELDFGAVDVGFTRRTGTATVYEVNTAPGLEGTTLERYRNALRNVLVRAGRRTHSNSRPRVRSSMRRLRA